MRSSAFGPTARIIEFNVTHTRDVVLLDNFDSYFMRLTLRIKRLGKTQRDLHKNRLHRAKSSVKRHTINSMQQQYTAASEIVSKYNIHVINHSITLIVDS